MIEIILDQAPQKYGTGPETNSQPLDLQSGASVVRHVTTALRGPVKTAFDSPCTNISLCKLRRYFYIMQQSFLFINIYLLKVLS